MKKLLVILALLVLLVACARPEHAKNEVEHTEDVQEQASVDLPVEEKTGADVPEVEAESAEPSAGPQTVKVDIVGFKYVPESVNVKVGDTVTWTQVDKVKHTVTIVTGPENFDSGLLSAGQTFSYTFTKPGTYSYKCTPHPNMRGEVIVG